jgi:nucleotide-binding universal stress UspA family protein
MKTIIVSTDFSTAATNAMNYAVDMAKTIDASILLLHVYQVPVSFTDVPVVLVSVDELRKDAESQMEKLKKNIEHITSGKVKVYTEIKMGDVIDELNDLCNNIQPFAVVMGTKGHSAFERALFGSNTLTAIKKLHCPVICVPPGKEYGNGIKKIGLACDFREVLETTPTHAIKELVKEFNGELHVLNIDYDNRQFVSETPEQSMLLHTMLEELKPQYHFIQHRDVEDGINEFAEKNNLDLVIAIPKKHKLLEGLFKKSSTKQLVFESHVPVMCVHE